MSLLLKKVKKRNKTTKKYHVNSKHVYCYDKVYILNVGWGIVKYIGNIINHDGLYYGIDLRDIKGDNYGNIKSKKYFKTRDHGKAKSGIFVKREQITKIIQTSKSYEYTYGMSVLCDLTDTMGIIRYTGIPTFAAKYSKDVAVGDQIRYGIELDTHLGNCDGQIQGFRAFKTRNGFALYVTPNQLKLLDETQRERAKIIVKRSIEELSRSERKQYLISGYGNSFCDELYIPNTVYNIIVSYYSSIINYDISSNIKYDINGDNDLCSVEYTFPPSTTVVSQIPYINKGIYKFGIKTINGTDGGIGIGLITNKNWKDNYSAKKWLFDQRCCDISIQLYIDKYKNNGSGIFRYDNGKKKYWYKMKKIDKIKLQNNDDIICIINLNKNLLSFYINSKPVKFMTKKASNNKDNNKKSNSNKNVIKSSIKLPPNKTWYPAIAWVTTHGDPVYKLL